MIDLGKLRRIFAVAAIVFVSGNSQAQTGDLRSAMESLTQPFSGVSATTNPPQRFRSEVRGGVTLGSGRVSIPNRARYTPRNIFSIQPPDYNIGCSGIDWHLGAASWVSLGAIRQMIEGAIPAAALFIANMLLGAISGDLLSSMREVMGRIQQANKALQDSCAFGQSMAQKFIDMSSEVRNTNCEAFTAEANANQDRLSARSAACSSTRALGRIFDEWATSPDEDRQRSSTVAVEQLCEALNNKTWCGLRNANIVISPMPRDEDDGLTSSYDHTFASSAAHMRSYAMGELMQSIMGTSVPVPADDTTTEANPVTKSMARSLKGGEDMMMLLLCGLDYMNTGIAGGTLMPGITLEPNAIREIQAVTGRTCHKIAAPAFNLSAVGAPDLEGAQGTPPDSGAVSEIFFTNRDATSITKILACLPEDSTAGNDGAMVDPSYIAGNDFSHFHKCDNPQYIPIDKWATTQHAKELLGGGILFDTVSTLGAAINAVRHGNPMPDRALALMERAPFPLYKMINIASVYPGGDYFFYSGTGSYIATIIAYEIMEQMIRETHRQGANTNSFAGEMGKVAIQAMMEMTQEAATFVDEIGIGETRALEFSNRIETLERSILRSIYQRNLLGNYAASVELVQNGGL